MNGPLVVGVGGEPAAGKSTLMRAVLSGLGEGLPLRRGMLRGTSHLSGRAVVLGTYGATGGPYPGTDRLSMAVQPEAVAYLDRLASGETRERVLLFEGDRLFNGSFLRACRQRMPGSKFLVLTASEATKAARREGRSDTKSEVFLRSRATKCRNILNEVPGVEQAPHETPADLERLAALVLGWVSAACR